MGQYKVHPDNLRENTELSCTEGRFHHSELGPTGTFSSAGWATWRVMVTNNPVVTPAEAGERSIIFTLEFQPSKLVMPQKLFGDPPVSLCQAPQHKVQFVHLMSHPVVSEPWHWFMSSWGNQFKPEHPARRWFNTNTPLVFGGKKHASQCQVSGWMNVLMDPSTCKHLDEVAFSVVRLS